MTLPCPHAIPLRGVSGWLSRWSGIVGLMAVLASLKNGGSFGSFAIRPAVSQEVCHSLEISRPHEARSCRVTCVLPFPAHWAASHEPLAGSRRCPSRPGLHLGVRTRSQRLVVLSPLPAFARFCRARPLTARAASSRQTHGASLPLPAIRAERRIRDGHLPSRRGTTASVHRHRSSRRPHRRSLAEPSRTAPLDNR